MSDIRNAPDSADYVPPEPQRENSLMPFKRKSYRSGKYELDDEGNPKRTRSMLQRLGIAPIIGSEEIPDVPRSPTGAIRSHSGITHRVISKLKKPEDMAPPDAEEEQWHTLPLEEVMKILETPSKSGLTSEEVEARLVKYGKNLITPPPQTHWFIKLLLLLVGGFQVMMIGGGFLCFIVFGISEGKDVQSLALGIVLIVVVLASAAFQYFQEGKADQVMESLRELTADSVYALRDGELKQVLAETLVPGDVIKVQSGEKVPADIRIFEATDLKVNNAPLTGENVDIKLGPEAGDARIYEAKNIARSGCNFTSGNGLAIVFATGDNTFFGGIAKSATAMSHPDTLMKREIRRLIIIMTIVAFTLGILFFILSLLNGYTVVQSILFFIGIIVANVPEGLLPQLTVALSLTAKRLQKHGVLVSNLEIIETLGAVTVICSDKTGTLTQNRMTVAHVVLDGQIWLANEDSPQQAGDSFEVVPKTAESFKVLQRILSLNTDAIFLEDATKQPDVLKRETKGDASETAMIKYIEPLRSIEDYRATNKRLAAVPFNSGNKWMLSINEREEGPDTLPLSLMVKGAPEKVLAMCSAYMDKGSIHTMTPQDRKRFEELNMALGKRGERVIAMACSDLDRAICPPGFAFETDPPNFPTGGLVMVGYVAMIDPPRPSVHGAIAQCHTAGVKVIMVTGDHPITARSIAKSLNMITKKTREELEEEGQVVPDNFSDAVVVHGQEMERYSQADWDRILAHDEIVFARTMPQQKQEIVHQLTLLGHVVAMTGDGVNDAPALKAAHVGIAMYSGAAVAKEAAQLVLLNDDFGAIVQGVLEGRLIFDNLKKCICYVLSSNVPEIVPFLLFIAIKIPLAIETIVILTIDIGTDLAPAVSIAFEGPEDSIMMRPPRTPDQHLVGATLMLIGYGTIGLFQTFTGLFAFSWVFIHYGFELEELRGAGVMWREEWSELEKNTERFNYFESMCVAHNMPECGESFHKYRDELLGKAQAAFLAAVVWSQIGNVLIRKTQTATIMTKDRILGNRMMLYSILSEIIIVALLIYVPGLNEAFMMSGPPVQFVFCSLWIAPFLIIWDEVRKLLCRRGGPDGFFNQYTNF